MVARINIGYLPNRAELSVSKLLLLRAPNGSGGREVRRLVRDGTSSSWMVFSIVEMRLGRRFVTSMPNYPELQFIASYSTKTKHQIGTLVDDDSAVGAL